MKMTTNSENTKTEELLKRCEESYSKGAATEVHLGYDSHNAGNYVVQLKNSTLKQLVELCRMQHEALQAASYVIDPNCDPKEENVVMYAIAAYERFERGE